MAAATGTLSLLWRRSMAITRARYAGHSLGWVWHLANPVALIAVYSIVFGVVVRRDAGEMSAPYAVFLCSGLLPYLFFAEVLNKGSGSFRANRAYLRKLAVSETVFVGEVVLSSAATLAIQLALLLVLTAVWTGGASWAWLLIPIPVVLLAVASFGFAFGLASLTAFFPDTQQVMATVLRLALWGAPVIFPLSFYTEHGLTVPVYMNPATPAVLATQELIVEGRLPSAAIWFGLVAWAVIAVAFGFAVHRPLRDEIKDVV
jgi:lipopolysaccharide transport system permease protein